MWRDCHPPRLSIVASFQHFSGGSGIRMWGWAQTIWLDHAWIWTGPEDLLSILPFCHVLLFFLFFPTDLWTFLVNDLWTFITLISTYLNKITRENYAFMIDLEVSGYLAAVSINKFYILNNIIYIFLYFFIRIYFKKLQTTIL